MTGQRQPQLRVTVIESAQVPAELLRRDADHHMLDLVDGDRPPDDRGIAPELELPEAECDDRFRFGASSLLNDLILQRQKERTGAYSGPDYVTLD